MPPIRWIICLQILSPKPEPRPLCKSPARICEKAWKSFFRPSGAIPMPVSVTLNSTVANRAGSTSESSRLRFAAIGSCMRCCFEAESACSGASSRTTGSSPMSRAAIVMDPSMSVNLIAFDIKLFNICRRRIVSPISSGGKCGSFSCFNSKDLACAMASKPNVTDRRRSST